MQFGFLIFPPGVLSPVLFSTLTRFVVVIFQLVIVFLQVNGPGFVSPPVTWHLGSSSFLYDLEHYLPA